MGIVLVEAAAQQAEGYRLWFILPVTVVIGRASLEPGPGTVTCQFIGKWQPLASLNFNFK
jgi:hypothetical protein